MARTSRGTRALRATALLTAVVLGGSVLAGCAADGDPEAGAATAAASPAGSATQDTASPSAPDGTPGAEPSAHTSGGPDADGSAADGEVAGASEDAPGHDDGNSGNDDDPGTDGTQNGSGPGDGDPGTDGEDADRDEGDADQDGKSDADGSEEPELPEHVAFGENSDRVTALQERLRELGYHLTTADGAFGGETQQALWALQKAAGLSRDGVVGPRTQEALDAGVVPQARTSSGKVIEIDLDRQLLLAVENGVVVRTLNAASGNGEQFTAKGHTYWASTPRGDFTVYNEIDGVHASTLELGDMNRPKYFNGGIAVHGSDSVPPYPASHGCVRVSHGAIDWIWDSWGAPQGTRVLVY